MKSLSCLAVLTASALLATSASAQYTLTLLHHNDPESQLINAGPGLEEFGGAARFTTKLNELRTASQNLGNGVVTVLAGDSIIPSPEFDASLNTGPLGSRTYFDAIALTQNNYDAIALGNHEFDQGTELLADFIPQVPNTTYLSANLDFSGDAFLNPLALAGRIAPSTLVSVPTNAGIKQVGIVGATTPNLADISSIGGVQVNMDVAGAVQSQIDALRIGGADSVILVSHLQGAQEDFNLINQLSGIDAAVAGGGDNLFANPSDVLIPGDTAQGAYPGVGTDLFGNPVPVVPTDGNYKYIGQLDLNFDNAGNLTGFSGGANRVASTAVDPVDGVAPDAFVQTNVVDPVAAYVATLQNPVGRTEVVLQGDRNDVRGSDSNLGRFVADAYLAQVKEAGFDADFAFVNGGGMRLFTDVPAGTILEQLLLDLTPFGNDIALVEITATALIEMFENAFSRMQLVDGVPTPVGGGTGRFLQYSEGVHVGYNVQTGELTQIYLNGVLVFDINQGGLVIDPNTLFTIAGPDFVLGGGDGYDELAAATLQVLGLSDTQATIEYLRDNLGGVIELDSVYGPAFDGSRIDLIVPEPATNAALALGAVLAFLGLRRLRRRA